MLASIFFCWIDSESNRFLIKSQPVRSGRESYLAPFWLGILVWGTVINGPIIVLAETTQAVAAAPDIDSESSETEDAVTRFGGVSLQDVAKDLSANNSVQRRTAALNLLPFCCSQSDGIVPVMLTALQSDDPAVVYWACENSVHLDAASVELTQEIAELANSNSSRHIRLAASFANYYRNQDSASLDFLLQTIETPRSGNTYVDTKEMASAVAAADYIARIGAERLGKRMPEVIQRLGQVSKNVQRDIDSKKYHWQIYHPQKACDRAIALLENPNYETELKFEAPAPDLPEANFSAKQIQQVPRRSQPDQSWDSMERPNILWISCEDISPNLGCFDDDYASTPNLDKLASQGVSFRNAFTHAGVCAVLRSGVITGRYPISIGTQHMRSFRPTLKDSPCFPELMRQAGYFCTNKSKTDYQFQHSPETWDREGNKHQDWRERAEGQPFFSVINLTISHESQVRHGEKKHNEILTKLTSEQKHSPESAADQLPPYFPNTAKTRQDWAWYSDNISEMDRQAGEILDRLEEDGLTDSTLVVFWSDHGQGLPRGKRWLYDSGTHVPMIVRYPDGFAANSQRTDLVTLLDLAPTMLAMAGCQIPENMDGRVLWGPKRQAEPESLFFHRDRMDETYDLIRSIRDHRFRYMRNFQPQRTYAQFLEYMELMPTMQSWRALHHQGKLTGPQQAWFDFKPIEELYDVASDPHQIHNLANDPEYQKILEQMRNRLTAWQMEENDWGMTPEVIMLDELWPESKGD